jgi:hypothetical protein
MDAYQVYQSRRPHRGYYQRQRFFRREAEPVERPHGGKFDRIIRVLCLGCGRTLHFHEQVKGYAWCYSCRRALFPESFLCDEPREPDRLFFSPY